MRALYRSHGEVGEFCPHYADTSYGEVALLTVKRNSEVTSIVVKITFNNAEGAIFISYITSFSPLEHT